MLVLAYFKEVLAADIRIWKSGELIFNIRGVYILWGKNLVPVRRLVDLFHVSVCFGRSYTQSPIYLWQLARCFPISDASGQWCVSSWPCQRKLAEGHAGLLAPLSQESRVGPPQVPPSQYSCAHDICFSGRTASLWSFLLAAGQLALLCGRQGLPSRFFFERVTGHASCMSETSDIFCHGMKATFEFVSGTHEGYLPGRGL